jgi:CIC family chloride channel protein
MTSVFMIFEITQDYQILVPLMVANLLSFIISRHYQSLPVYHALLHQDGVHLPSPATQAARAAKTAREVMQTDVMFMPPDLSLEAAWRWALEHDAPVYLVGTRERLFGVVAHQQLEQWKSTEKAKEPVSSVAKNTIIHAHADHPIGVVLERLAESGGVLPIVSRTEFHRVEGVVTPESILPFRERRLHSKTAEAPLMASAAVSNEEPVPLGIGDGNPVLPQADVRPQLDGKDPGQMPVRST